jgi:hypothetical protein
MELATGRESVQVTLAVNVLPEGSEVLLARSKSLVLL